MDLLIAIITLLSFVTSVITLIKAISLLSKRKKMNRDYEKKRIRSFINEDMVISVATFTKLLNNHFEDMIVPEDLIQVNIQSQPTLKSGITNSQFCKKSLIESTDSLNYAIMKTS